MNIRMLENGKDKTVSNKSTKIVIDLNKTLIAIKEYCDNHETCADCKYCKGTALSCNFKLSALNVEPTYWELESFMVKIRKFVENELQ